MYFQTFGGSALLHLLLGHPRLVALFGIAATVALTSAPHGPGRYQGTGDYLDRIEASMINSLETTTENQERAVRATSEMLEHERKEQIEAAVDYTLRQCGPSCTDLTTPVVIDDPDLLEGVLILYQLDRFSTASRIADGAPPSATHAPETARR